MQLIPRYDGPAVISIDGPADDQRAPLLRQRRRLETMLQGLDDEAWRVPSRCEGWTVHDVVAHLVGVNAFWHASVTAGLAGRPTRVLAAFDPAATPPLMIEPMRSLAPAEVLDQFVRSNDAFLGAISTIRDDGWATPAEAPPGHLPIRLVAQHAMWDAWVHERDVALPLGQVPDVEPDEVTSCLRYAAALGPAFAANSGRPLTGRLSVRASAPDASFELLLGTSVAVVDEPEAPGTPCLHGDAVGLVEGLSLRSPLPSSAPAEWRRALGGLAAAFDADPATA